MNSKTYSSTVDGIYGKQITVEAHISGGYPSIKIIGIPTSEGLKQKERVISALKSSKLSSKPRKTRINITPDINCNQIKHLDLPIALALILAYRPDLINIGRDIIAFGELSLNGAIKNSKSIVQLLDTIKEYKNPILVIPKTAKFINPFNKRSKLSIVYAESLKEAARKILNKNHDKPCFHKIQLKRDKPMIPFDSISELYQSKRALLFAVAGRHHLLLAGPLGTGKSILLQAASEIFPELSHQEKLEALRIQNILSAYYQKINLPVEEITPQTTKIQLNGGQRFPYFGITTKTSNGILIANDIAEFPRQLLLALKNPLENNYTLNQINKKQIKFPARFTLFATTNLCKCGRTGNSNKKKPCKCTPAEKNNYLRKIPETLINRIDLLNHLTSKVTIRNPSQKVQEWEKEITAKSYYNLASRAKEIQNIRYKEENYKYNQEIPVQDLKKYCVLTREAERTLKLAEKRFSLNGRDIVKTLRVAQTAADIDNSKKINKENLLEAVSYRTKSLIDLIDE